MDFHTDLPESFNDILHAPAFIINMDPTSERYRLSVIRAITAGFKNLHRVQAVNGADADIKERFEIHPLTHDVMTMHPQARGCMFSHLIVLKHIMDNKIPYAIIFEDDILFHKDWHILAPKYYKHTPKRADYVYMGHHCGNAIPYAHIVRVPVYCTHAMIVTEQGAHRMYEMLVRYPYEQTLAIDIMAVEIMRNMLQNNSPFPWSFEWYVWNSEMFPDLEAQKLLRPNTSHKDKGLVFQQWFNTTYS